MADERLYQIGLTMINGVGDILSRQLLQALGSAEAVFSEKSKTLEKIPGIGKTISSEIKNADVLKRAENELAFIEKNNIETYFYTDEKYPKRLKQCADSPLLFYFKGNANPDALKCISIVGTRNITEYGNSLITEFIKDLSKEIPDLLVVSGLAYGVDIKAHRESLRNSLPTIAVLAHGLDRIYPPTHRQTAVDMLSAGGLLTDFPSGTNPDRPNFVKRNRIVAGLSDATIVVESAIKGGSLITADIAFSYSRDVFAFPGRISDMHSAGCNKIIQENKAAMITNASDFIAAMNWQPATNKRPDAVQKSFAFTDCDLSHSEAVLIKIIEGKKDIHINQLARESEFSVQDLTVLLFELEMKGCIQTLPGNTYKLL